MGTQGELALSADMYPEEWTREMRGDGRFDGLRRKVKTLRCDVAGQLVLTQSQSRWTRIVIHLRITPHPCKSVSLRSGGGGLVSGK